MLELPRSHAKKILLLLAAAAFVGAGIMHFVSAEFFVAIMPPYLPLHLELVWISGVFGILGGVGLLIPRTRRLAGWGLLALLIAVYPANIHMAMNPESFAEQGVSRGAAYARLPFQFVFMAWVVWVSRPDPPLAPGE